MRIAVIGGGPAGLYFSLLMKRANPSHVVEVFERNKPDDTFGWGVVFSDQTLGNLAIADPVTHQRIIDDFIHWDDIDIYFRGQVLRSGGHGFCGIARKKLLNILQERAHELEVKLHFETEVGEDDTLTKKYDVVIVSDGANSLIRRKHTSDFQTHLDERRCRYIWLGTRHLFEAFTFVFEETPAGWFQVHAYRFDKDTSTVIVECREETWKKAGLEGASTRESIAFCEDLFGRFIGGAKLLSNASHLANPWIKFIRVNNATWRRGNTVLLGDAAHTAHFSIGSGTKLAMEDAIVLARALNEQTSIERAFEIYEDERRTEVLKLQSAARNSMEWFEHVKRYTTLDPTQFAYSLLTRSQRFGHENLRLRDKDFVRGVESWIANVSANGAPKPQAASKPIPPMFTPFKLRDLVLQNRVVVSPMAMYSAIDGTPNDFYLVHLGARAQGGAGLVFTEMTNVADDARISPGCAGMYKEEHVEAWTRIVDFVHRYTPAKIALQLGHAGPKGSTQLGWEEGDEPLESGNWPLIAPTAMRSGPNNQLPKEMTRADMDEVRERFVRATEMGESCGFDMLELHCAHGYLFSSFITPLSNQRTDEYGGSLENRMRYPLEVFRAMRAVWPKHKPMSVRISATDWVPGGIAPEDSVEVAHMFKKAGADLIDVSAGQTSRLAQPVYGRMFQTPFSDRIRNEVGIATMAVGNIFEPDHVNSIIAAGRADLCALARPHLADPYWTLHAAAALGYTDQVWPVQYLQGKSQLERNLARAVQPVGPI
ncbi:MAG TPA: bifunctional salicylyl-CoA 5-hydroxylase/oxidoreductase [Candidatus Eremiobacteraceae bacterium]|nr:bifunctional salicylyl-CoA 5-hydroxylase/oxidoreductase [Candidatus Eremiobacteraceae bacterium]